jgi:hypothetical protein
MYVKKIKKNLLNFSTYYKQNKGLALFVAVLVGSIAIIIGMGVLDISLKEIKLSVIGRGSAQSFYSADTGLECALYWDLTPAESIFATSTDSIAPGSSKCIDSDITNLWDYSTNINPERTATAATTTFWLMFGEVNDPCAFITVAKYQDVSGSIVTAIDSRGYNKCQDSSTRRVERGIRAAY